MKIANYNKDLHDIYLYANEDQLKIISWGYNGTSPILPPVSTEYSSYVNESGVNVLLPCNEALPPDFVFRKKISVSGYNPKAITNIISAGLIPPDWSGIHVRSRGSGTNRCQTPSLTYYVGNLLYSEEYPYTNIFDTNNWNSGDPTFVLITERHCIATNHFFSASDTSNKTIKLLGTDGVFVQKTVSYVDKFNDVRLYELQTPLTPQEQQYIKIYKIGHPVTIDADTVFWTYTSNETYIPYKATTIPFYKTNPYNHSMEIEFAVLGTYDETNSDLPIAYGGGGPTTTGYGAVWSGDSGSPILAVGSDGKSSLYQMANGGGIIGKEETWQWLKEKIDGNPANEFLGGELLGERSSLAGGDSCCGGENPPPSCQYSCNQQTAPPGCWPWTTACIPDCTGCATCTVSDSYWFCNDPVNPGPGQWPPYGECRLCQDFLCLNWTGNWTTIEYQSNSNSNPPLNDFCDTDDTCPKNKLYGACFCDSELGLHVCQCPGDYMSHELGYIETPVWLESISTLTPTCCHINGSISVSLIGIEGTDTEVACGNPVALPEFACNGCSPGIPISVILPETLECGVDRCINCPPETDVVNSDGCGGNGSFPNPEAGVCCCTSSDASSEHPIGDPACDDSLGLCCYGNSTQWHALSDVTWEECYAYWGVFQVNFYPGELEFPEGSPCSTQGEGTEECCCNCPPPEPTEPEEVDIIPCIQVLENSQSELVRLNERLTQLQSYKEVFNESYQSYINKQTYFISKEPEYNKLNGITLSNSLLNIKSIKSIPIRSSRYEIFARQYNVKIDQFGGWLYNAYLGNGGDPTQQGNHPIYDQKYSNILGPGSFKDCSENWEGVYTCENINQTCLPCVDFTQNPPTTSYCDFAEYCFRCEQNEYGGPNDLMNSLDNFTSYCGVNIQGGAGSCPTTSSEQIIFNSVLEGIHEISPPWGVIAPQWHENAGEVLLPGGWNPYDYSQRYNFYQDDLTEKVPTLLKRKQLERYIRIEFEKPIGTQTLDEFAYGFVRDAGYEYFIPYIVNISPGPYGRQGVNKNIAIIGMDPYGFDVAVEPDDPNEPNDLLYQTSNTERPYFTTHSCISKKIQGKIYGLNDLSDIDDLTTTFLTYSSVHSGFIGGRPTSYYSFRWMHPNVVDVKAAGCKKFNIDETLTNIFNLEDQTFFIEFDTSMLYNGGLSTSSVWKYDVSGNSTYGLLEPPFVPTNENNNFFEQSIFGKNFSAQFTVYSREVDYCKEVGYECANPAGNVSALGCPPEDPWCNCPCRELLPRKEKVVAKEEVLSIKKKQLQTQFGGLVGGLLNLFLTQFIGDYQYFVIATFGDNETLTILFKTQEQQEAKTWLLENGTIEHKPTLCEIKEALEHSRECTLIEEELGESWMGCMWTDQKNPMSCNCPCVGENFSKYIEYNRTRATFYDTPDITPLLRTAQMKLIQSNILQVVVMGDFSKEPGDMIEIFEPMSRTLQSNISGKWIITEIEHDINNQQTHFMILMCMRDTNSVEIKENITFSQWIAGLISM